MIFNTPNEVLYTLVESYYKKRDIEATLSCVTDDIEWVGTEYNESASGKKALRELLEANLADFPEAFNIKFEEQTIKKLGTDAVMINVVGKQMEIHGTSEGFEVRGTVGAVRTNEGWLISNVHASVPNSKVENINLKSELDVEREKQNALLAGIPGGIAMYRVKKDGRIATDYVSDGLAKICGYEDGKDIMRVMEYDSRTLVLEEDFPIVRDACKASLEQGIPTSVNYRIHGKDGSAIRLTLDSVIMHGAKLGEDDVAVFYAVQTLVSDKANKEIEEQKAISKMMDSVPAGLGIYEMKDGVVTQVYMNDAFYDMIGSNREKRTSYLGSNAIRSAHPDDVDNINKLFIKMMNGCSNMQLDYRMKNDQDEWIWIHARCSIAERRENYVKIYIAFYECTETKKQQLELIQSRHAVELAQERGNLSIWTYNIDKAEIVQQCTGEVDGYMGYQSSIKNVPKCFVEAKAIHPDDVDKFLAAYEKVDAGESRVDEIYRLIDQRTGQYNWVHMFYQQMDNKPGEDKMVVGFSMNVNKQQEAIERYKVEQKLREQMYNDAVVYAEYNLMTHQYEGEKNLQGKYQSQQWEYQNIEQYIENMKQNVEEQYLENVVKTLYSENLIAAFERGENRVKCEYRSKARPGKPQNWYRVTASMAQRPDTDDVMAFIYVEDIEESKKRELAIESSISDGIENIAIIHVKDGKSKLIRSNDNNRPKYLGMDFIYDNNFVERSHRAVVPEERHFSYEAALLDNVIRELCTKEIYQYSVSMCFSNDDLRRQLFKFRYLDDRKADIVLSISDITSVYIEEQKKKEELKKALLEVQNVSNAKTEFYSRMSHDMRTPMNGILGMAELSEEETDITKLKENIKKIQESGEYLLRLVNDTLDLQKIESGKMKLKPRIVNTLDIVNNIIDMVSITAEEKGITLKYTPGNADLNWYIKADDLRLKQIFINLLSNAVKFTPKGGTVEFEFRLLEREGMISHDVIYVRDTGVGMSEQFLKEGIFMPFSQESNEVSSDYAGSGLGLSIAKSLVELMGGRIEVKSEIGVGTTFAVYIDFERVDEKEAQNTLMNQRKAKRQVITGLKDKQILLVEDNTLNAEIAKKILEIAGCIVTWTKNGQEAVDCFEMSKEGTFNLVLMDIRMPVMDGLEATRRIRALQKADASTIPIVAMTANAYEEDIKEAMNAGMNAHLGKPIDSHNLFETIAENIEG